MGAEHILSDYRRTAVRYWERRRWIYIGALAVAAGLGYMPGASVASGVGDQHILSGVEVLSLFGLAFIAANACYSVVYMLEFVTMGTKAGEVLVSLRVILLGLGCLLGMLLAYVVAHSIFRCEFGII